MTTTEEIVVSGEDFIERRIILWAGQDDINESKNVAYTNGYRRGCTRALLLTEVRADPEHACAEKFRMK